jgi:hypothetical protein
MTNFKLTKNDLSEAEKAVDMAEKYCEEIDSNFVVESLRRKKLFEEATIYYNDLVEQIYEEEGYEI